MVVKPCDVDDHEVVVGEVVGLNVVESDEVVSKL